jgi:hypothetical protein
MSVSMMAFAAVAASGTVQYTIPLRGGDVHIQAMNRSACAVELTRLAWRTEDRHALILLDPAEASTQQELAAAGVDLLSSLGGSAWIASLGPEAGESEVATEAIAWVGPLETAWKLHPFLAAGGVPDWTVDRSARDAVANGGRFAVNDLLRELQDSADPRVVTYVLAHRDEDIAALAADIEILDAKVLSVLETVHGLIVRLPMSTIVPLAEDPRVLWVEPALPKLVELNDSNRVVTQVGEVQDAPYNLDGDGVVVMVYDGGYGYSAHGDFGGRHTARDSSSLSNHATHVAGTIGGDGSGSGGQFAGMAPAVTIESYGFEQEGGLQEGFLYTDPGDLEADYGDAINQYGAVIANNSIGTNTASNGFPCEWTGDYGVTSSVIDSVVRGALGGDIRIMWANGNERQTSRCGDQFYTTAPPACAKNHITVGALNSNDESVTSFTSWGPTDDGRIKPDISTAGCQSDGDGGVTSCSSSGGYTTYCGTSMASPTACGIGALLMQDWRAQFPKRPDMRNSTLKAMLAHTAADLGNVGPDLKYGYGSIRAKAAVDHLRTDSHLEAEVSTGEAFEFLVISSAGDSQLQVTLAWDDEPAVPLVLPSLVNDLDLIVYSPDGTRHYPWAIDPANPGDPATQMAEDHLNNIEQVTVESPQAGVWRVQIHGYAVPVGPQAFSVMATPNLVACSRTGIIGLDRTAYPLEGELSVTVVDCDLNLDDNVVDTVDVLIRSDDEPAGEWLTLVEEDPAASAFSGTMVHSTSDAPGVLYALHGSTIEAIYLDAEDADGNTDVEVTASAGVDGEPPSLLDVQILEVEPRAAHLIITPSEPAGLTLRYGTSCDDLSEALLRQGVVPDHDFWLSQLTDATTYFFDLTLVDAAGNESQFDNGGACWSFTTPDVPDFFTEQFTAGLDLDGMSIRFDPIGGVEGYLACGESIVALPVDPSGGTTVSLGDDASIEITPDQDVVLYGAQYASLWIGSNGFVTFGSGDSDYSESLTEHFAQPRISGLWDDLNPSAGGTVSWKNLSEGVAITWQDVPEYSTSNSNTFQIVMEWSGTIRMSWLGIDTADAVVGLSEGVGQDPDFEPSDLSESTTGCGAQPPNANGQSLSMAPGGVLNLTLTGSDDGLPNPPGALTFYVDSLPSQLLVDLDTGAVIEPDDLPYVPYNSAYPNLSYVPMNGWQGVDSFTFHVDDGGAPPDGGASSLATVEITVADGPEVVYTFPMDTDPGWSTEGQWAFGQPTGGGGQHGYPDPTSGATGDTVMGYDLAGDYANDLPEYALTTGSLDCSTLTDVELRFMRYLNVEQPLYDNAAIRVSVDGGIFSTIWENTIEITDSSWTEVSYDLSDLADGQSDVRIRWVMGTTDSSWQYSGWNIDDVQIIAVSLSSGVPGDANGDGMVNADDILAVISAWGQCPPGDCPADVNGDGVVNTDDLLLVIANWGAAGTPRSGGSNPDVPDIDDSGDSGKPTIDVLINDDRFAPADSAGLISTAGAYLQRPWATLEMEVAGLSPLIDRDLLVIGGTAWLDGRLVVRLPDRAPPAAGRYELIVAGAIEGWFADVRIVDPWSVGPEVCLGERVVTLIVPPAGPSDGAEPMAANLLGVINAMGERGGPWDLDADGLVTEADLSVLLGGGGACR